MVFYADRNTSESTSLVPSASLREVEHNNGTTENSFGSLNVTIRAYAPSSSSSSSSSSSAAATTRCDFLQEFTTGLNCTSLVTEEKEEKEEPSVLSVCRVEMSCSTKSSSLLRGKQEVLFGLPDTFQTIEYYVTNSFWDDKIPPITIRSILSPERPDPATPAPTSSRVLVGTQANPTTINIEATRSIRNDTRAGRTCDTRGLQLSWIDEQRVDAVDEGTADGRHYVSVAFHVQSATYQRMLEDQLSFENRVATVLTYMLSVIAFLKIVKMGVQVLVDYMYKRRSLAEQPPDVVIRHNVLNEVADVANGNGGGGGGGGVVGDIEMPPMGGGGGMSFINPMPGSRNLVSKKRRSSAPAFEPPPPAPRRRGEQQQQQETEAVQKKSEKIAATAEYRQQSENKKMKQQMNKQQKQINEQQKQINEQQKQIKHLMEIVAGFSQVDSLDENEFIQTDENGCEIYQVKASGKRFSWNPNTDKTDWLDDNCL